MPRRRVSEFYAIQQSPTRRILDFRRLDLGPVRVVGRYRYATAQAGLETHSHGDMIEICYLESGQQIYEVAGQTIPLNGGDVFMTLPYERHSTAGQPESRGVLYWMLVSMPAARRSFLHLPSAEGDGMLRRLLQPPRRCFRARRTLGPILHRLFEVYEDDASPLRRTELRSLLIRFFIELVASATEDRFAKNSADIRGALNYIEARLMQRIPLAELARHVNLSLSRLKTKFKAETGIAPADYILRRKVECATSLLSEGSVKVVDVAFALGFCSSQHFATVYKRYTGHSPRVRRTR